MEIFRLPESELFITGTGHSGVFKHYLMDSGSLISLCLRDILKNILG